MELLMFLDLLRGIEALIGTKKHEERQFVKRRYLMLVGAIRVSTSITFKVFL